MPSSKTPPAKLYYTLAKIINKNKREQTGFPEFPHSYYVIQDHAEEREILKERPDRTVFRVSSTRLKSDIYNYCSPVKKIGPQTPAALADMAKTWMYYASPIAMPAYIADKSDEGIAFARLPFDSKVEIYADGSPASPADDFPKCFQSILDRCTNSTALCAFIGSLFYPQADCQQYIFMKGEGNDSKGSLLNFLSTLLKQTSQSTEPPKRGGGQFWNSNLLGKRLIMMPDCNEISFFVGSKFKSLTGGDPVMVERKFKEAFTVNLNCKFIVASNNDPMIDGQEANIRRIIYCKFESVPKEERDPNFVNKLLDNAQAIIKGCKYLYLDQCRKHGPIPCDPPTDLIDENEFKYVDIFDDHFEVDANRCLPAKVVQDILTLNGIVSSGEIKRIKAVWSRRFKVDAKAKKISGKTERVYLGMTNDKYKSISKYKTLHDNVVDFPVTGSNS